MAGRPAPGNLIVTLAVLAGLAFAQQAIGADDLRVQLPAPGNITVAKLVVEVESAGDTRGEPPQPKLALTNRATLPGTVAVVGAVREQEGGAGRFEVVAVLLRGCGGAADTTSLSAALAATVPDGWKASVVRPPGVRVWQNVRTRAQARFDIPALRASYLSRFGLTGISATDVLRRVSLLGKGNRTDQRVIALLIGFDCSPPGSVPGPPTAGTPSSFELTDISLTYRVNSTSDADVCLTWSTKPSRANASATITVSRPGGKTTVKGKTNARGKGSAKVNVKANFGTPLALPFSVSLQMQDSSGPVVFSGVIEVGPLRTRPGTCTL